MNANIIEEMLEEEKTSREVIDKLREEVKEGKYLLNQFMNNRTVANASPEFMALMRRTLKYLYGDVVHEK